MISLRTLKALCLVAGFLFVPSGISKAEIFLTVNTIDVSEVTLEPGESCTIEIVSDDDSEYEALVGFEWADPLGLLFHIETRPEAGLSAMVFPIDMSPAFYGYEVMALGGPQPGIHFVFQYEAESLGQVVLGLWDSLGPLLDEVLITVWQQEPGEGACCDYVTGDCYMSDFEGCSYSWLGEDSDCSMCVGEPPPEDGACCDETTGECYMSEEWECMLTWLGAGSDCSMCEGQPPPPPEKVVIKRFEINQCFQDVNGTFQQIYALIETKPFAVEVNLGTEEQEAIKANVELKIFKDDTLIISKLPYREDLPITIEPGKQKKCLFRFIDNETKDMKAGIYKFSLVAENTEGTIIGGSNFDYAFKSSHPLRILAVEKVKYGGKTASFKKDSYIKFIEQVFPVPKKRAKDVNRIDIAIDEGSRIRLSSMDEPKHLFNEMGRLLNKYNEKQDVDKRAVFICAVIPRETSLIGLSTKTIGLRSGNAFFVRERDDTMHTLGHEFGHCLGLGEEYVKSKKKESGLWPLDETFYFDCNPPPLKKLDPGDPSALFIIKRRPNAGQLCKWAENTSSYPAPTYPPPDGVRCEGRFIGEGGYDSDSTLQPEIPPSILSMMSSAHGEGFRWISGPEYKHLISILVPSGGATGAVASPAGTTTLSSGQRILVSGIIDINEQTAEISPLIPVSNLELTPEANDPNCQLVFESSTETFLGDFNFTLLEGEDPNSDIEGPFCVIVDLPTDTARIQVTIDGVLADELQLSDNSPVVSVLSPNGGEEISGEMHITWSASDPDSNDLNDLSYTVEFSHDNGTEWSTLIIDHEVNELTVDSNDLPGGPNCLVKVIASDGWNSTEDASDAPFTISTKPPEVTILDPEDGAMLLNSQSMQGYCSAYDPETGDINDPNAIVWSSNIDGFLGNGNLLGFQLSLCDHILTATATDPEAKTGIDTVRVKVLANASDFNCDFHVSFLDLANLASRWQTTCTSPNWCEGTDLDRSGFVDFSDLYELCENWLWQME